ncbi:MAG: peptidylprolyl isomerase [Dehalococcoidales bacterium]|nr:peptidylprolyl isomerase [Dehalococcoidales bacterium]
MAKKKKEEKHERRFTRHQLARWQQQKKRQRIFLILGLAVIGAIGGVIGSGWYRNEYRPMQEVVIKVNETEFDMGYYVDTLKISGRLYQQIYGESQYLFYMQSVADQAVTGIEQRELIRQGAMALGIVVSDSEVSEELKKNDPPLGSEYRDLVSSDMLRSKLLDEYFEQEVPQVSEQRQVMAMFLESDSRAAMVRKMLEAGEDFAKLSGEFFLESLTLMDDGQAGWYPPEILSEELGLGVVEDYVFAAGVGLSGPVYDETMTKDFGYWLVKLVEKDEDEQGELYNIQVMLLGSEEEAQGVIDRLELGVSGDFAEIAGELSQDTASKEDGGDLGWLDPEEIAAPFADFVLAAEPGALSEPIKDDTVVTKGGYWLIDVLGIEDGRQILEGDREFLKTMALDEWISSLWDDPANVVESYLDAEKIAWAIDRAVGS